MSTQPGTWKPRWIRGLLVLSMLAALAALPMARQASGQVPIDRMTPGQWTADIDHLQRLLERSYGRGPTAADPGSLAPAFDALRARVPELSGLQVVMELTRVMALLGDGHSSVSLYDPPLSLRRIPLSFYVYGDELRVNFADRSLAEVAGARVDSIGGLRLPDLRARLSPYVARDNDQELLHYLPQLLATPAVIHALGLAPSADAVPLELTLTDGRQRSLVVALLPQDRLADNVFARPTGDAAPLYVRDPDRNYWFRPLPARGAIYVKFNVTNNARSGPSIAETARAIEELVSRGDWRVLVFDLRHNSGGNFHRADPFVALARRFAAGGGRQVYAIVSRHTFSAALVTAMRLRAEAGARIVGETPRGRPNFTYNTESARLPNSGIVIDYTDQFRTVVDSFGQTEAIALDLEVQQSFTDYQAGRDPVLERILDELRGDNG